jgi:hypothetical protein
MRLPLVRWDAEESPNMRNERKRNESRKKDGMKRGEKGRTGEGGASVRGA